MSTDWKEARRMRACELKQAGWKQQRIAEALGVTKGAVSQWMKVASQDGQAALCARPRPGAPKRLSDEQLALLPDCLSHGAAAYGFRGEVWTCARVGKVIEQEFSVVYDKSQVSRVLKHIDWTPQKPIERASQRDETKIEHWRKEVWIELKKKARLERRVLVFVDESGFYLLPACVRTYAPCGHTPILRVFQTHDHWSVMSGITLQGGLFTLTRQKALTGVESVMFLNALHRRVERNLLVIWDGSPIHRGAEVKDFLGNGGSRFVHLEQLPPYAPDLNPDEATWQYLKRVEMRNVCCLNVCHLHHELNLAIARLRRRPHIIQSFFTSAGLPF